MPTIAHWHALSFWGQNRQSPQKCKLPCFWKRSAWALATCGNTKILALKLVLSTETSFRSRHSCAPAILHSASRSCKIRGSALVPTFGTMSQVLSTRLRASIYSKTRHRDNRKLNTNTTNKHNKSWSKVDACALLLQLVLQYASLLPICNLKLLPEFLLRSSYTSIIILIPSNIIHRLFPLNDNIQHSWQHVNL